MSRYLDLTWRIRYEGADREVLRALDESDAIRKKIILIAVQRAQSIVRGNAQMQEALTIKINKTYGEWLESMRYAHKLVKIAKLWGDPTMDH